MLAQSITSINGASKVFNLSVVTYSNDSKSSILKVPKNIINKFGAVSEECCLSMVKNLAKISKSQINVSITGIAGPKGGSKLKPVGLVFIGINYKDKKNVFKYLFPNKSVYVTHSKLSFKMSGLKQEWFPHQDSAYKIHNATGYTVAVLLEKCDESNGTILVYPRSHSKGKLKHKIVFAEEEKEPQIKVERMPNTTPCPINGNEGDVFFFDLDTIHSSGVNKAGGYRCILIFEVEECTKFPLEADGKDALYWNFSDRNLVATPFDNIRRTRLFVQNNIVGPVIKKILYS